MINYKDKITLKSVSKHLLFINIYIVITIDLK